MAIAVAVANSNNLFKVSSPFIKYSLNSKPLPVFKRGSSILEYVSELKRDVSYSPPEIGTTRMRVSTVLAVKLYAPEIDIEIGNLLNEVKNVFRLTTSEESLERYGELTKDYVLISETDLYPFKADVLSIDYPFYFKGQETTLRELSQHYGIAPNYFGEIPYNRVVPARKQSIQHIHSTIKNIMHFKED